MIRNRSILPLVALALVALCVNPAGAHEDFVSHAQMAPFAQSDRATETMTGIVHVVTIDDQTTGASSRYAELALDDGTLVPLFGAAADALNSGSRMQISGRRDGKRIEIGSARLLAAPAGATKANAEVDGTLAILHADNFVTGTSAFFYEVHGASGRIDRLHIGSLPAALRPGMQVRVVGRIETARDSIAPDRITIVARPTKGAADAIEKAATANNVLVILANFNNTAAPSFTSSQAQQVMTTNADSVANFFREASFGQQLMNVTVTPSWVTMNLARPATCGTGDWQGIGAAAEAAARTLGAAYDASAYDYVVYLFPTVSACGWLGLAYIGFPHESWINGVSAFDTDAIAHELGHNFGLLHAASLRCSGTIIGGSCSVSEYGDPFDTMGNQRAMHYNAMQKSKLAWIGASTVRTHTGGSATYTLTPIELGGGATYAVRIPTASANRTYWVEFRQPIGFDAPLASFPNNGAEIRVAAPFETLCGGCDAWSDDTQLLDMTPWTSAFTDATLPAGQTFSDSAYGVNVTVLSATASALTIQVATGGAPPPPPPLTTTTTTLAGSPNPSTTGAPVTFTATITGSVPTGMVAFTDNGATIVGCGGVGLAGSGDSRSANCATSALATGSHTILASYAGDDANTASSASMAQTVTAPVNGTNVALASNGGVATASTTYDSRFAVTGVNDNERAGRSWGAAGGWNDGTPSAFPDWVQITFNGQKTIDHVVVYTVQDNYANPSEPTDTMQFTLYGLTSFDVQAWNGTAWVSLGSVTGNNLVKRTVSFAPVTTDRIRIVTNGSADRVWSRITEVEAWSSTVAPPASNNYALASNGGVASASSTYSASYPVASVNDNQRSGAGWGSGSGGWNDHTQSRFPDWVQVRFSGSKQIDHVVVYTVQDNYANPVEPTDALTFTRYGLTGFTVQGWSGSAWVTLGTVTGNQLVKRTVSFSPYATDRIRILCNTSADGIWSRITEIEAWGS